MGSQLALPAPALGLPQHERPWRGPCSTTSPPRAGPLRLRAVVHPAGSVRGRVTEACWERGIEVSSAAAANDAPVAEYTLGMIVPPGKQVRERAHEFCARRTHGNRLRTPVRVGDYGRTVGIVSASLVGRRVIELLRPRDFEVLLYDPYADAAEAAGLGVAADDHLSVEVDGRSSTRRRFHPPGAGHGDGWGWAASWHRPVFVTGPPMVPGLRVESVTVAYGRHELRVHQLVGAPADSRVTHTGWATGPEQDVVSALHGLHGWDPSPGTVCAPRGTAFTWGPGCRASRGGRRARVCVGLATLSAGPDPRPLAQAVSRCAADETGVEVTRAGGARTRITFDPLTVSHDGNR
ncbi:hypothetical protein ACH4VM_25745 [Streptomyces sp. NPDC020792]|uniref:hypothetical protein n=1 Tax=Streptomyces sp. NPDC020792 TaxID=3365089 RepID=UPI003795D64E